MANVDVDKTPLQKALLQHLGKDTQLLHVCTEAVNLGQMGANGDFHLFSKKLTLPSGREYTVEEVITIYHLNAFIEWGGGDV